MSSGPTVTLWLLWMTWTSTAPLFAEADGGRAILIQAEERHRSVSQEHTAEMIVTSRNGKERRRVSRNYREGSGANVKNLTRFLSPPDVRGVGLLTIAKPERLPDRWMYLPSMKRERRLAPQDQGAPFVGTDFTYEDLQELDHSAYEVSQLADQSIDGQMCYVIALVPRGPSTYARKIVFLRKDNLCLVTVQFFRADDREPSKQLDMTDYDRVSGHWIARTTIMADLRKGSRTTVRLSDIAFDRPQPLDRYTIQNLVREGGDEDGSPRAGAPRNDRSETARNSLFAGQTASGQPEAQTAGVPALGITGSADIRMLAFATRLNATDPSVTAWATLFVKKEARIGRARFAASVRAEKISSTEGGSVALDLADRRLRRSPLSIRELFVVMPVARAIDVQVGRYELPSGRTDGYSPADAFLPRDLSDPFAEEKLPLWGAGMRGERGAFRFDLYSSFVTTPWRLPPMEGRYSPFSSFHVFLLEPSSDPPRPGFQMLRLARRSPHWDVEVWGRTGVRPAPILDSDVQIDAPPTSDLFVPVVREFAREHAFGIGATRDAGGWMLRGEAAAFQSPDGRLGNALVWSAEAEHRARSGTLFLTVAGNAIRPPTNPLLLYDRAYLPGFVAAITQAESWGAWHLSWLGTARKIGGLLKGEVSKDLRDGLKLTLATHLPYGSRIETPGAFWGARHVRASVRWSW